MSGIIEEVGTLIHEGEVAAEGFIKTVEHDVSTIWGEVTGEVEKAALDFWGLAKPILENVPKEVIGDIQAEIKKVLSGNINLKQDLTDLEGAVLMSLENSGSYLFAHAKDIGSTMLQVLIGLVIKGL